MLNVPLHIYFSKCCLMQYLALNADSETLSCSKLLQPKVNILDATTFSFTNYVISNMENNWFSEPTDRHNIIVNAWYAKLTFAKVTDTLLCSNVKQNFKQHFHMTKCQ